MPPQFKFFRIAVAGEQPDEDDFNRFLRSVKVLSVRPELVHDGGHSFWACAVEYLTGDHEAKSGGGKAERKKVDYRELLPPEDFAIFAKLREWRKEVADRDAVPVYTVFTNEQLAQIAGRRITDKAALAGLDGVGEARIAKYGEEVFRVVVEMDRQQRRGEDEG